MQRYYDYEHHTRKVEPHCQCHLFQEKCWQFVSNYHVSKLGSYMYFQCKIYVLHFCWDMRNHRWAESLKFQPRVMIH
jgi:hypothetical protein